MSTTFNTRAIILGRENWREDDKRAVFYSIDYGKLEAVAIGAAKIASKLAGHLEPGRQVDLMLAKGKNIDKVGQAVTRVSYLDRAESFEAYWYGQKCLNLVDALTRPGQKDLKLFALLKNFLQLTGQRIPANKWPQLYYAFSLKLLELLGFRPRLELYRESWPLPILKISQASLLLSLPAITKLEINKELLLSFGRFTKELIMVTKDL